MRPFWAGSSTSTEAEHGEQDPGAEERDGALSGRAGRRCGVSRQTINAIENNKYDPTLTLAFHLAGVLGTTVDELFLGPGEKSC